MVALSPSSNAVERSEPPTADDCDMLLLEVKALCMPRRGMEDDMDVMLNAYGRRLRDYPRQDVFSVLRAWPEENKFWPTWAELKARLNAEAVARLPRQRYVPPPAPIAIPKEERGKVGGEFKKLLSNLKVGK